MPPACALSTGGVKKIQFFTAPANPPRHPRRVAPDERVRGHVPRDHRAGGDHRPASDGDGQNSGVGPNGAALLQMGFQILGRMLPAARTQVVGEGRAWPDEHVVLQFNAAPQVDAAFDCHAVANPRALLNKCVVAKVAIFPDDRAAANMRERPNPRARAHDSPGINQSLRMKFHSQK